MTAEVPVPSPTRYEEQTPKQADPDWATVEGLKRFDGVDQPATDSSFSVRVQFQPAYVSPDWDFMAAIGQGGGSSEAGAGGGQINTQPDRVSAGRFSHSTRPQPPLGQFSADAPTSADTSTLVFRDRLDRSAEVFACAVPGDTAQAMDLDGNRIVFTLGPVQVRGRFVILSGVQQSSGPDLIWSGPVHWFLATQ